jgi:outer membrane protein, multidrug efflux system
MKQEVGLSGIAGFCALLLSGCVAVGPDYVAPDVVAPDAWHEVVRGEIESGSPDLQRWWTVFNDPVLDQLIERASLHNLTLKEAVAQIERSRALRGVSKSGYLPQVDAFGSSTATGHSEGMHQVHHQAGVAMGWELDLWGRIGRSLEAADAQLLATIEDYHDVMVVLYGEVAANYITLRTLQERIALADTNLKAQTETQVLTRNRFEAGLAPALDVAQAELNRARTAATIPPLRQQWMVAVNRLSVLTGALPYALEKELAEAKPIPAAHQAVVVDLPAELLRKRPDIRRAERLLAAQTALIGAQKAALYPTLTLPGTLSLSAINSEDISSPLNYAFGPSLRWNLFSGGRIRNLVKAEEAATQAALHRYEQTVLLALEEVEASMSGYVSEKERIVSLASAAKSAQESVNLVSELYKSGLTDFQNVLNMERALLEQQDAFATSRGQVSLYLVQLYRAMGGGWAVQ